jgi:hypothetical protein
MIRLSIKHAILPIVLCLTFFAIEQAQAAPVWVTCEGGEKECQGSYAIANMATKQFVGRCQPKREIAHCRDIPTTLPLKQRCAAASKNVTCTRPFYRSCSIGTSTCDCTNWALKRNTATSTVTCAQ